MLASRCWCEYKGGYGWLVVVVVVLLLLLLGHLSCVRHAAGGVPPNGHTDEETQHVYKMPGTAVQAQLGLS